MLEIKSVSKVFCIRKRRNNFLSFFTNLFEKKENFVALNEISFSTQGKEIIGLVGKNGSGKSTFLKIISGIFVPTSGSVELEGNVVYVSGFYNGLNRNLSFKDNIFILGTLNGLSQKEIADNLDEILDFSELRDFLDVPLYKFSTGMLTRAAFSITVFTLPKNPDILLLDEFLGGGLDDFFKEKTLKKIQDYINSAKTVIVASHNLNYILNNCSRTIWIERGEIKMIGEAQEVISEYKKSFLLS